MTHVPTTRSCTTSFIMNSKIIVTLVYNGIYFMLYILYSIVCSVVLDFGTIGLFL